MIYTIVGTRPNILKIDPQLKQEIINTGQHYNDNMSKIFFNDLDLPEPKYNLKCTEVGEMIDKLRIIFRKDKPTLILVFGDTNSSLAGALAGAYEKIQVAHIEAGMRSYNDMPEEINRVLIDKLAKIKLCPNESSMVNLEKEKLFDGNTYLVGDPMVDTLSRFLPIKKRNDNGEYILLTIHREENTNEKFLKKLFEILEDTKKKYIFPVHPRTKKVLGKLKAKNIKLIEPQGYKEMLELESYAKKIITDSGGVQREGAWMNIPTLIIRETTEWTELVDIGSIKLTNLKELSEDIKNFKGVVTTVPNFGVNKRIRETLSRYV